jgi:hypothetical protein
MQLRYARSQKQRGTPRVIDGQGTKVLGHQADFSFFLAVLSTASHTSANRIIPATPWHGAAAPSGSGDVLPAGQKLDLRDGVENPETLPNDPVSIVAERAVFAVGCIRIVNTRSGQ